MNKEEILNKSKEDNLLQTSEGEFYSPVEEECFELGFNIAWEYQQHKLDAYTAYVAGKITLAELEEALR